MFLLTLVPALHAATPAAVQAYTEAHLFRSAFAVSSAGVTLTKEFDPVSAPLPWGVFNGLGNLLTAETFADAVNDTGMIARFRTEHKKAEADTRALTIITILAVGVPLGGAHPDGLAAPSGPPSKDTPQQSPVWIALSAGRQVSEYYTAELADQLIVSFNASLRRSLGLSVEEAAAIDVLRL